MSAVNLFHKYCAIQGQHFSNIDPCSVLSTLLHASLALLPALSPFSFPPNISPKYPIPPSALLPPCPALPCLSSPSFPHALVQKEGNGETLTSTKIHVFDLGLTPEQAATAPLEFNTPRGPGVSTATCSFAGVLKISQLGTAAGAPPPFPLLLPSFSKCDASKLLSKSLAIGTSLQREPFPLAPPLLPPR